VPGGRTGFAEQRGGIGGCGAQTASERMQAGGRDPEVGHGPRNYAAPSSSRKSSASSITVMLSAAALASLSPASSPATTAVVRFETADLTTPPAASIRAVASRRLRVGSVPVSTKI